MFEYYHPFICPIQSTRLTSAPLFLFLLRIHHHQSPFSFSRPVLRPTHRRRWKQEFCTRLVTTLASFHGLNGYMMNSLSLRLFRPGRIHPRFFDFLAGIIEFHKSVTDGPSIWQTDPLIEMWWSIWIFFFIEKMLTFVVFYKSFLHLVFFFT